MQKYSSSPLIEHIQWEINEMQAEYETLRKISSIITRTSSLEANASKVIHQGLYSKYHLTAIYLYIRAENSSTCCTSVLRGFCKMLQVILQYFVHFESVRSIVDQRKNNNIFTGINVFFKALNFRFWQVSQSFKLSELFTNVHVTCKAHKPCQWKASSPLRVVCVLIYMGCIYIVMLIISTFY